MIILGEVPKKYSQLPLEILKKVQVKNQKWPWQFPKAKMPGDVKSARKKKQWRCVVLIGFPDVWVLVYVCG